MSDLLSQLRDIHTSQTSLWWPPAVGWWIVAGGLLALIGYGVFYLWRGRLYGLAWRELLSQADSVEGMIIILKRACLHRKRYEKGAALGGEAWITFLKAVSRRPLSKVAYQAILQRYSKTRSLDEKTREEILKLSQRFLRRVL